MFDWFLRFALYGGEWWVIFIHAKLERVLLFSFGKIFGNKMGCYASSTLASSPLHTMRMPQWMTLLMQRTSSRCSSFLYPAKLIWNVRRFCYSWKVWRSTLCIMTHGSLFGALAASHRRNSITLYSSISPKRNPYKVSGNQKTFRSSRYLLGCSFEIA